MQKDTIEKIVADLGLSDLDDQQKELVANRFMQSYNKRLEVVTTAQVANAGLLSELENSKSPEESNAIVKKALGVEDDGLLEQAEALYENLIQEFKSLL